MRPVGNKVKDLMEIVKYGSKVFTEPYKQKNSKREKKPKVFVKALHNIFLAMKGLRIFERFGFNLSENKNFPVGSRVVNDCKEWEFDIVKFDWFNSIGERLSDYIPSNELLHVLRDQIDKVSQ